ncbi:SCAI protein, partial [Polypterus senegalus]
MDSAEDITYFRERTEDLSEEITMLAALLDSDIDETVFEIIEEQVEWTLLHSSSDQSQRGSLFTLFLYNPLMAFLHTCGLSSMRRGLWDKCQDYLRKVYRDVGQLITRARSIDQAFLQFFGDEFLRLLLIRFVFCSATLRLHKIFRETRNYPETYPQLPKEDTIENPLVQKHILELASMLDVQNLFFNSTIDDY